jgi:hypothetical protein
MNIDVKKLGSSQVLSESGLHILMSSFWKDHPAVFVFLRHFGCIAGRAHATQLWGERAKFEKKGSRLVFISNGPPGMIKAFKEDLKIEAEVFTDPGLSVYSLCGFKRSIVATVGPKSLKARMDLKKQGFEQKGIHGDIWQQGGVIAIGPQNKVLFHFVSEYLGDFPESNEMPA